MNTGGDTTGQLEAETSEAVRAEIHKQVDLTRETQALTSRQLGGLEIDLESAQTRFEDEPLASTERALLKKDVRVETGVAALKSHLEGVRRH